MFIFFFFNDPTTTEIYTLSLHDALPIYISPQVWAWKEGRVKKMKQYIDKMLVILPFEKEYFKNKWNWDVERSEEHTSELQSRRDLVCRLLLEKKKKKSLITIYQHNTVHS